MRGYETTILHRLIYCYSIWGVEEIDAIFLTFDYGFTPIVTPWASDQLDGYNDKTTFFHISENPKELEQMI